MYEERIQEAYVKMNGKNKVRIFEASKPITLPFVGDIKYMLWNTFLLP